jgi:hypothetical protein
LMIVDFSPVIFWNLIWQQRCIETTFLLCTHFDSQSCIVIEIYGIVVLVFLRNGIVGIAHHFNRPYHIHVSNSMISWLIPLVQWILNGLIQSWIWFGK